MKRLRGVSTRNSPMNRDNSTPRPNLTHAGSGRSRGQLHAAPTRPQINSANYGGQRIRRK
jgi:hypothetical protein